MMESRGQQIWMVRCNYVFLCSYFNPVSPHWLLLAVDYLFYSLKKSVVLLDIKLKCQCSGHRVECSMHNMSLWSFVLFLLSSQWTAERRQGECSLNIDSLAEKVLVFFPLLVVMSGSVSYWRTEFFNIKKIGSMKASDSLDSFTSYSMFSEWMWARVDLWRNAKNWGRDSAYDWYRQAVPLNSSNTTKHDKLRAAGSQTGRAVCQHRSEMSKCMTTGGLKI